MTDTPPVKVLLADDEHTFAHTTARLLERHGLQCQVVNNGTEALARLHAENFDVLVADIKMPGNDELELLRQAAELVDSPVVILITGYPSIDTASISVELGAFAYKIKPFDLEDFIQTVKRAGEHACMQRRVNERTVATRHALEQLLELRQTLTARQHQSLDQSAREYLQLLLVTMGDTAMEATNLLDCMAGRERIEQPVRKLSHDPQAEALRNAIQESVAVLERTKNAFKSSELASLRRRLSKLLELTA